jgi:hypothetical protein
MHFFKLLRQRVATASLATVRVKRRRSRSIERGVGLNGAPERPPKPLNVEDAHQGARIENTLGVCWPLAHCISQTPKGATP